MRRSQRNCACRIGEVRPVKIDALGLQPFKTFLDRANHVLAAVAGARDTVSIIGPERVLSGEPNE